MFANEDLLSNVEVTVYWAMRRQWESGDTLISLNRIPRILTLYLVEQGSIELTLDGRVWWLEKDDLFLIPPLARRDRIVTPQGAVWLSLGFSPRLYGSIELASLVTEAHYWRPFPGTLARVRLLLEMMIAEREEDFGNARPRLAQTSRARNPVSQLISEGLTKALFGLWWRETEAENTGVSEAFHIPRRLREILNQMRRNPALTLKDLQTSGGISGTYLRRQFHQYLGCSPHSYLTECRLVAASRRLQVTNQTVATIAAEVGFASLSHFTRLFTQRFGVSPARYRLSQRQPGS